MDECVLYSLFFENSKVSEIQQLLNIKLKYYIQEKLNLCEWQGVEQKRQPPPGSSLEGIETLMHDVDDR